MWYARKRHTEKLQGGMERDKLGILTNVFYKQREDFAKQQKEQEERFTFPEEVEEITDIVYIEDGKKEHRLNVYRPRKRTGSGTIRGRVGSAGNPAEQAKQYEILVDRKNLEQARFAIQK